MRRLPRSDRARPKKRESQSRALLHRIGSGQTRAGPIGLTRRVRYGTPISFTTRNERWVSMREERSKIISQPPINARANSSSTVEIARYRRGNTPTGLSLDRQHRAGPALLRHALPSTYQGDAYLPSNLRLTCRAASVGTYEDREHRQVSRHRSRRCPRFS